MTTTNTGNGQPVGPSGFSPQNLPALQDALGSIESDLERLRSAAVQLEQSQQAATDAAETGRQVSQTAAGLTDQATKLLDRLDRVDFPLRLDKLDASVSALQVGLQTTQGRLDNVERNLQDAVRRAQERLDKVEPNLQDAVRRAQEHLERLVAQHAATQNQALQRLRLLLFGGLALQVVLVVLAVLIYMR